MPLVFGNLTAGQPALLIGQPPTPDAVALSVEMRSAWTWFAAGGDPGWPAYDVTQLLTQVFDCPSAVVNYPEDRSRARWLGHPFDWLPLLDA